MSPGLVGSRIRHLRITRVLGAGGMGAVYEAFDENLRRKVALKAIRPEARLEPRARARFLREARILSHLDHPRICRIHDVLLEDRGDFLVLELVEGRTLSETLRREGVGPDRAMEIAEQLTEALIAAHEKGVVHRDLKPGNVMLTPDGVKVLDFGLSRSSRPGETRSAALPTDASDPGVAGGGSVDADAATVALDGGSTREVDEARTVAAPVPWAETESPGREGASTVALEDIGVDTALTVRGSVVGTLEYMSPEQAAGEPLTASSDVYSLGLVLQEMFGGRPPHPPGTPPEELIARALRAESQPADDLPDGLASLLGRLLAPAPGARPSARDVAEHLRRIRDAPRLRRKRRAATALVVGALVVAAVLAVQSLRIRSQAERIEREARASTEIADFLIELFEVSDPSESRGEEIRAREILDRGAARIELDLAADPGTRGRLMTTMGRVYASLGLFEPAERLLAQGVAKGEEHFGVDSPELVDGLLQLGSLRRRQERFDEAAELLERAVRLAGRIGGLAEARALEARALLHLDLAEHDRAEALVRSALERVETPDVEPGDRAEIEARLLHTLSAVCFERGEVERAIPLAEDAVRGLETRWGPSHPGIVEGLNNLAGILDAAARSAEAERLYRRSLQIRTEAFGEDHPDTALSLNNLGHHLWRQGRYEEAEAGFRRALEIWRESFGPRHGQVAVALNNLATLQLDRGRLDEAEELLRESITIREEVRGADHPEVGVDFHNLASLLLDRGRFDDAERAARRAIGIWTTAFGPDHPHVAASRGLLAGIFEKTGDLEEAESLQQRNLELLEKAFGPDHPSTAGAWHNLAALRSRRGDDAGALEAQTRALATWEATLDDLHPHLGIALLRSGSFARRLGRTADAEAFLERAEARAELALGADADSPQERIHRAEIRLERARLALDAGEREDAEALWHDVADTMLPLAAEEDSESAREAAVVALLSLGRVDEARPLVTTLIAGGNRDPEVLALAREHGLPADG